MRTGLVVIALVILVLGYLIARPHLGTVWYLSQTKVSNSQTTVLTKEAYLTQASCQRDADTMNTPIEGVSSFPGLAFGCQPQTKLLWGL